VASFDPGLARRPQVVAASQIDLPDARAAWELARPAFEARGITLYGVSAVTGEGVREIVYKLESLLQTAPQVAPRATALPRELGRRPREEAPGDDEDEGELEVLRG